MLHAITILYVDITDCSCEAAGCPSEAPDQKPYENTTRNTTTRERIMLERMRRDSVILSVSPVVQYTQSNTS